MMKKVLVYSTPTCPWCTKVKDYLDSKDVPYEHYDVSQDRDKAMEMVKKSGQQGVPVLDIEGEIVVGFDQNKINEILGL
jgi:glutaredoxin-like YruB-family protein